MPQVVTAEARVRYNANRRLKKKNDPAYAELVRERNRKKNAENKDKYNATRRAKYQNDPEYRERQRAYSLRANREKPQTVRNTQLKIKYGITLDRYNEMLAGQGNACAICREPATRTLHVDHCHATGRVRALLCAKCNAGLGCYRDDTELMKKAIAYLEAHRGP